LETIAILHFSEKCYHKMRFFYGFQVVIALDGH
jgi:hypothetical protein